MPVPEDNPITAEQTELGTRLFNDRPLSRDQTIVAFLRAPSGELTG